LDPLGNPFGIGLAVAGERIMLSFQPDGPQRYRVSLWANDSGGQRRALSNGSLVRTVDGDLRFRCIVDGRSIRVMQQDSEESVERKFLDHVLPTNEHYALDENDAHYPCTMFLHFTAGQYRIQKLAITSKTPPKRVFSPDSSEIDRLKRALWRGGQVSISEVSSPLSGTPFSEIASLEHPFNIERIEPNSGPVRSGLADEDFDWLSRCKQLRTLDLRNCEVTEMGLERLQELEALETLVLDPKRHDVSAIAMVRPGKSLARMMLPGFQIRGQDMPCFRSLGQLTYLCLNQCTLDRETAIRLPEYLPRLDHLCFNGTNFRPESLPALEGFDSLAELQLAGTEVSDFDLQVLARMQTLQFIDLASTNVSLEGIRRLREKLPAASIRYSAED